jgi:hypothetical protein
MAPQPTRPGSPLRTLAPGFEPLTANPWRERIGGEHGYQDAPVAPPVRQTLAQILEFWLFERFHALTDEERTASIATDAVRQLTASYCYW